MPVTDDQVAALRAQLAGDSDEHYRLLGRLDKAAASSGYTALVTAAFFEAVERRFAKDGTVQEVIEWVGERRATSTKVAEDIDPSAAERLIRFSLGDAVSVSDVDARKKFATQVFLLNALIDDLQLEGAELDSFMAKARAVAEAWTK